jgi:hypothetical protein
MVSIIQRHINFAAKDGSDALLKPGEALTGEMAVE